MKPGWMRTLASFVGRWLHRLMPGTHHAWAAAMTAEIESIEADGPALRYAIGCLWAAACARAGAWWRGRSRTDALPLGGTSTSPAPRSQNGLGIGCGTAATLLGGAVMAHLGAPVTYIVMQLTSLLFALATVAVLPIPATGRDGSRGWVALGAGLMLLALAVDGASFVEMGRWIRIGPLSLQPSSVVVPWMVVVLARHITPTALLGVGCAAAAVAMQDDLATSTALLCALLPRLRRAPGRPYLALLVWAVVCWFSTLLLGQSPLPLAFVDGVVSSAFTAGLAPGLVLCAGLGLMLAPALAVRRAAVRAEDGAALQAFGAFWSMAAGVALCANYPTPLVGFGGSAVLGYFLSLTVLPARLGANTGNSVTFANRPAGSPVAPSIDPRRVVRRSAPRELARHHHHPVP
jgi:hypothetical protein